jgi:hypothetical protein
VTCPASGGERPFAGIDQPPRERIGGRRSAPISGSEKQSLGLRDGQKGEACAAEFGELASDVVDRVGISGGDSAGVLGRRRHERAVDHLAEFGRWLR